MGTAIPEVARSSAVTLCMREKAVFEHQTYNDPRAVEETHMSRSLRSMSVAFGVLITLAFAAPCLGSEGRIPIFAPTVITASGKYFVVTNIAGDGSTPVISVQASDVDLDLNGFRVTQPNSALAVILVGAQVDQLVIRNGTISSGAVGIDARTYAVKRLIVEDVTVAGAISSSGAIAVYGASQIALRRLVISGVSGSSGIAINNLVPNASSSTQGVVEHNLINGVDNGIRVQNGSGLAIIENSVNFGSGGTGFGVFMDSCQGCQIRNNSISAQTYAIELDAGAGNVISGNTIDNSSGITAIRLLDQASYNVISNNSVRNASGDGIRIQGSYNRIEGNLLGNNSQWGLHLVGCQNTYGRNVARGNNGSGCGAGTISYGADFCNSCIPNTNLSFVDNEFANGLH